jgi:prepilin-type N-terminal cleavage/methylation domain-containing protein
MNAKWNHSLGRRAFTLTELLIVMAIITILAGLLFPAISIIRKKAKEAKARSEVKMIEAAIKQYYTEYGKFPHGNGNTTDWSYGAMGGYMDNRYLMNVLRSVAGDGNDGYTTNTRRIVFLDIAQKSFDAGTNWIDPWDNQYEVVIDTGYDNICSPHANQLYPSVTNKTLLIFSKGANKVIDTGSGSDDIRSWE